MTSASIQSGAWLISRCNLSRILRKSSRKHRLRIGSAMLENLITGAALLILAGVAVLAIIVVRDMWRRDGEGGE